MKRMSAVLVLFAVVGCQGDKERIKKDTNRTVSIVNVVAERLAADVTEDGWFRRQRVEDLDAWGAAVGVKYTRTGATERMEVRSSGPDGLPYTPDDVVVKFYLDNEEVKRALKEKRRDDRERLIEGAGRSLFRGITRGGVEGLRGKTGTSPARP